MKRVTVLLLMAVLAGVSSSAAQQAAPAPSPAGNTFTDPRDGQTYRVVRVGNQTWMAENLNYQIDSSWCYGNNNSNCSKYGRLYDWNTAMKACPAGWRLPTDDDWNNLVQTVGGSAGRKLKSKSGWEDNRNGTDDYGFSALPGGGGYGGSFYDVGSYGFWWSASEHGTNNAWYRNMGYDGSYVYRDSGSKMALFAARCLQK